MKPCPADIAAAQQLWEELSEEDKAALEDMVADRLQHATWHSSVQRMVDSSVALRHQKGLPLIAADILSEVAPRAAQTVPLSAERDLAASITSYISQCDTSHFS